MPVPWQAGQWAVMVRRWPRWSRPQRVTATEAKPSQAGQILGGGGVRWAMMVVPFDCGWKERPRVAACLAACAPPGGLSASGAGSPAATALGRVHGGVGGGERVGEGGRGKLGDAAGADRGGQRQRRSGVGQRPVQCGGERLEVGGGQVLDDGDEFVSAQAAGGAVAAAPGAEPVGGGDEGGVPGGVAVGVVQGLEVVEVGSARVPGILNVGKPEPACQLMVAAVPRAGSGLADGTW